MLTIPISARLRKIGPADRPRLLKVLSDLLGHYCLRWPQHLQARRASAQGTDFAPPLSCNRDRVAVVAQALLQIVITAPQQQLRIHLEEVLRDEFTDVERQAIADRGHSDA